MKRVTRIDPGRVVIPSSEERASDKQHYLYDVILKVMTDYEQTFLLEKNTLAVPLQFEDLANKVLDVFDRISGISPPTSTGPSSSTRQGEFEGKHAITVTDIYEVICAHWSKPFSINNSAERTTIMYCRESNRDGHVVAPGYLLNNSLVYGRDMSMGKILNSDVLDTIKNAFVTRQDIASRNMDRAMYHTTFRLLGSQPSSFRGIKQFAPACDFVRNFNESKDVRIQPTCEFYVLGDFSENSVDVDADVLDTISKKSSKKLTQYRHANPLMDFMARAAKLGLKDHIWYVVYPTLHGVDEADASLYGTMKQNTGGIDVRPKHKLPKWGVIPTPTDSDHANIFGRRMYVTVSDSEVDGIEIPPSELIDGERHYVVRVWIQDDCELDLMDIYRGLMILFGISSQVIHEKFKLSRCCTSEESRTKRVWNPEYKAFDHRMKADLLSRYLEQNRFFDWAVHDWFFAHHMAYSYFYAAEDVIHGLFDLVLKGASKSDQYGMYTLKELFDQMNTFDGGTAQRHIMSTESGIDAQSSRVKKNLKRVNQEHDESTNTSFVKDKNIVYEFLVWRIFSYLMSSSKILDKTDDQDPPFPTDGAKKNRSATTNATILVSTQTLSASIMSDKYDRLIKLGGNDAYKNVNAKKRSFKHVTSTETFHHELQRLKHDLLMGCMLKSNHETPSRWTVNWAILRMFWEHHLPRAIYLVSRYLLVRAFGFKTTERPDFVEIGACKGNAKIRVGDTDELLHAEDQTQFYDLKKTCELAMQTCSSAYWPFLRLGRFQGTPYPKSI